MTKLREVRRLGSNQDRFPFLLEEMNVGARALDKLCASLEHKRAAIACLHHPFESHESSGKQSRGEVT